MSKATADLSAQLLSSSRNEGGLDLNVALAVYGNRGIAFAKLTTPEKRRYYRAIARLDQNDFGDVTAKAIAQSPRLAELARRISLGLVDVGDPDLRHFYRAPGAPAFLPRTWRHRHSDHSGTFHGWTRDGAVDLACLNIMQGRPVPTGTKRLLIHALDVDPQWARKLIISMCAASLFMRTSDVRQATRALASAEVAYRGFERLRAKRSVAIKPELLVDYENHCRRILAAFDPPHRPGKDPVRSLSRVARQLPRHRSTRADKTIDALDVLITAGREAPVAVVERRVVRQLARMLGARVLLHRNREGYLRLEDQRVHTLSTWTIRRLVRTRRLTARRIRPKPEFWRPEQRRPRGVLAFPIGTGVACLARQAPFRRKDVRAVRVVLRFLDGPRAKPARHSAPPLQPESRPSRGHARLKGLVGEAKPWRRAVRQVWKVAPSRCSILLRGETGTGKEVLAHAVHVTSPRVNGPFVAVNCAALGRETFLAELFGHTRGAFTGAIRDQPGLIRRANRGTLFLDEIGDMPPEVQVALLRVLQDGKVHPVGSIKAVSVDVRVISATHRNLAERIRAGLFREDLLHRLNVVEIDLPPLRARMEDLPALAEHVLSRLEHPKRLHMDTLEALAEHTWPGNVRELENLLEAAALLSEGDAVEPEVVRSLIRSRRQVPAAEPARLSPRADLIMARLGSGWWSAPALAAEIRVSTRTINRDLQHLMRRGLVERYGEARASRYRRRTTPCRDPSGYVPS